MCVKNDRRRQDATLCAFEEIDQYFALGEFSLERMRPCTQNGDIIDVNDDK